MAFDGTQACLPVRPAEILPAAKVSCSASLSDATDAVSDIMSALPVAAGFKPAGRTGRRPVFREVIAAGVDAPDLDFCEFVLKGPVSPTPATVRREKSVSARRRNQHARRVCYPEGMRAIGAAGNTGMFACAPSGDSPRCKG